MQGPKKPKAQFVSFYRPSLANDWRLALQSGDLEAVLQLMKDEGLSPSHHTNRDNEHPLKTLLMSPLFTGTNHDLNQALIAQIMIERGCEISVPDKLFMIPADYALLSGNYEAAKTVMEYTYRYRAQNIPKLPYFPDTMPFFATCHDMNERALRYDNLCKNHRLLRSHVLSEPHITPLLTDEERHYWEKPFLSKLCDMTYPTAELMRQQKNLVMVNRDFNKALREGHKDSVTHLHRLLVSAKEEVHFLAIDHVMRIREENTVLILS